MSAPAPTWYERMKVVAEGLHTEIEELRMGRAGGMVGRLETHLEEIRAFLAEHDAKAAAPVAETPSPNSDSPPA
jgi:hypothetical protein